MGQAKTNVVWFASLNCAVGPQVHSPAIQNSLSRSHIDINDFFKVDWTCLWHKDFIMKANLKGQINIRRLEILNKFVRKHVVTNVFKISQKCYPPYLKG